MARALCEFSNPDHKIGRGLLAQIGPTLRVDIGFDTNHDRRSENLPDLAAKGVHALIDTGASLNCIDVGLAMQLELPVIDRGRVNGSAGAHEVNMHLGHVLIPALSKSIFGAFAGINLAAGRHPHVAVLGRTFLQDFVLYYDGRTGLAYISDELPLG
jgi:hypothetical protein